MRHVLRSRARALAFGVLGVLAIGCGPRRAKPDAPQPSEAGEIEAELLRNEAALREAGIAVPPAPTPGSTTPPPPEPEPEPDLPVASPQDPTDLPTTQTEGGPPVDYADAPEMTSRRDAREESIEAERNERSKRARRGYSRERRVSKDERKREDSRCSRICDLADATCQLHEHICRLAEAHPDEPRYETSCIRAEQQCQAADQACRACEEC